MVIWIRIFFILLSVAFVVALLLLGFLTLGYINGQRISRGRLKKNLSDEALYKEDHTGEPFQYKKYVSKMLFDLSQGMMALYARGSTRIALDNIMDYADFMKFRENVLKNPLP